jgi:DNA-binding NtrC family response regulator
MTTHGRLLIADDEETFLLATAELLRREGYEVDTVPDAHQAIERVRQQRYDLLVSDLEMPGNEDLALIRQVAEEAGGLPVIIVTGFPSTGSAIASIELPVSAYLLKPVRFDELLARVRVAVSRFQSYQAMRRSEDRLKSWREEMGQIAGTKNGAGVDAFLTLTLRNVMGSLTDLEMVGEALTGGEPAGDPCHLINCPRGMELQAAVRETIAVLEETRTAFKSKTLADLRKKLELLLSRELS